MHHSLPHSAPAVGMRIGKHLRPAVPVHLDGHRAAVVIDAAPLQRGPTSLHLDWDDGRVTELEVHVRSTDGEALVAHMDIYGIKGDWRPFLEYLARAAA